MGDGKGCFDWPRTLQAGFRSFRSQKASIPAVNRLQKPKIPRGETDSPIKLLGKRQIMLRKLVGKRTEMAQKFVEKKGDDDAKNPLGKPFFR